MEMQDFEWKRSILGLKRVILGIKGGILGWKWRFDVEMPDFGSKGRILGLKMMILGIKGGILSFKRGILGWKWRILGVKVGFEGGKGGFWVSKEDLGVAQTLMCSPPQKWGWQPGRPNTRMVLTTNGGGMVWTLSMTGSSIFCWLGTATRTAGTTGTARDRVAPGGHGTGWHHGDRGQHEDKWHHQGQGGTMGTG